MIRKSPYNALIFRNVCLIYLLCIGFYSASGQQKCSKAEGLSAGNIGDHIATLSWSPEAEHVKYEVDVMHGAGTPSFKYSTSTTDAMVTIDGLEAGSNYRFRVMSKCEKGSGGSSKWFEFSTTGEKEEDQKGGGNDDKGGGKCPGVTDVGATQISDTGAVIEWSGSDDHTSFKVDIMHAPQSPSFKWSGTTVDNALAVTDLSPGRKYRFRVMASCDKGKSNTNWLTFSTTGEDTIGHGRCPKASNLAVLDVTDTTVTLSWLGNPENVDYQVDVHQKEHTPQYMMSEVVDTTILAIDGLIAGGNYKFRVKAACAKNSAGSSSWINFVTTGGDSTFNQCPKPRNLSVLETSDSSALLSWVPRDSAVSFNLEIKSFEGTPSYHFDTTLIDTFYLADDLLAEGNYHFRVIANCTDSTSSGSSDWSKFRTLTDTTSQSTNDIEDEIEVSAAVESQVNAFPNPVEEELNVVLPLDELGYLTYIMLTDLSGRVVYEQKFEQVPSEANLPIPVQGLTPGVYKLAINSINFSETKTILIQ